MGKGRFLNQKLGKRVSRLMEQRRGRLSVPAKWGGKGAPRENPLPPRSPKSK
jgi:hypothetical protein